MEKMNNHIVPTSDSDNKSIKDGNCVDFTGHPCSNYESSNNTKISKHDEALQPKVTNELKDRRLVLQSGEINISLLQIQKRRKHFFADALTTTLDMKWRYVILLFMCGFFVSWIIFALIYWLILIVHEDHLHYGEPNWTPCMGHVFDWRTALLFSVESQHTIGYGSRGMEDACPVAMVVLMIQSCIGVFIQCLITGIVFQKILRPKARTNTLTYSKKAVICKRDGEYVLVFRVADLRERSHIVSATIRCIFIQNRMTQEGEMLPLSQKPLDVLADNAIENNIFLCWPTTITHKIDESSPFWDATAETLKTNFHFQIIAYLEGTVETTGNSVQARTSYIPDDILWGHRLDSIVTYQSTKGQYKLNYSCFHKTIPIEMPQCSAREFEERQNDPAFDELPPIHSHKNRMLSDSELYQSRLDENNNELGSDKGVINEFDKRRGFPITGELLHRKKNMITISESDENNLKPEKFIKRSTSYSPTSSELISAQTTKF